MFCEVPNRLSKLFDFPRLSPKAVGHQIADPQLVGACVVSCMQDPNVIATKDMEKQSEALAAAIRANEEKKKEVQIPPPFVG